MVGGACRVPGGQGGAGLGKSPDMLPVSARCCARQSCPPTLASTRLASSASHACAAARTLTTPCLASLRVGVGSGSGSGFPADPSSTSLDVFFSLSLSLQNQCV